MILRSATITELWKSARSHAEPGPPRRGPGTARIDLALRAYRAAGHRAVRILDLDCGNGDRLFHAAERARALGFVAIEGRGSSLSTAGIRHARRRAANENHPSTDLHFEVAAPIELLASEHDGAADLVLLAEPKPYPASPLAVALERVCIGEVLGEA